MLDVLLVFNAMAVPFFWHVGRSELTAGKSPVLSFVLVGACANSVIDMLLTGFAS
jgi:hypothetical protein